MPSLSNFFEQALGPTKGYFCVAARKTKGRFTEQFFAYPEDMDKALEFIRDRKITENVYFCPQVLSEKRRVKENVTLVSAIWADLDDCPPEVMHISPSVVLETSTQRWQALWYLNEEVLGADAEAVARKIAYGHSDQGSDRSGWDLTQLLRVPGTFNHKYTTDNGSPQVRITKWDVELTYPLSIFDVYAQVPGYEYLDIPFPDNMVLEKGEEILERYRFRLNGAAFTTFFRQLEVGGDRSTALFRLEMYCFEAGMNTTEIFQVARDSVVNKFTDEMLLWKDICRAFSKFRENNRTLASPPKDELSILRPEEMQLLQTLPENFVDRYIAWAKTVGDAAEQYHVAGAFVALSSMLCGAIRLPTSFGTIAPNVWFMLLADTTLTRKSTAMDLAMDCITEIDESIMMATDGSMEGLMTALSVRDNMPSVFLRDEFTGLVEQMHKKDYMAGMPEFLAKIYDGKTQKRMLRKEEIKVKSPRFIIFAGGIKTKMQRIIQHEHVESGFLPRFVIITAMSDISKVKPLGPPLEQNTTGRNSIVSELKELRQRYPGTRAVTSGGKVIGIEHVAQDISMSQRAWLRFNELDQTLMQIGLDSGDLSDIVVPMNARLSISILKCAMLVAAARTHEGPVVISEWDLIKAAQYGDSWRRYAQDIIVNVGKSEVEHKVTIVLHAIQKKKSFARSRLMQTYHLTAREMNDIEATLINRGLISRGGEGRAVTYNSLLGEN